MLSNYFKIAWRNLIRGKSFSIINISGLAIGMAGAILILLWMEQEISFDQFHSNKERLYEVYGLSSSNGKFNAINSTAQPLGPAIKQDIPEIEATARFADVSSFLITVWDKRMTGIAGAFVDPAFLQLFSFPLVDGGKKEVFSNLYSIVITENLARKLFGSEPALNKIIQFDSTDHFLVTGILKDLPANSRFSFEYLLPWDYLKKLGWNNDSWLSNNISTFLLLKPEARLATVNDKIRNISRHYANRNDIWTHFLFPLDQWHLYSAFENGKPAGGRIETVRLFGIIAAFILLIACINFMNLSTANSERRAKEVGIRKVAGAGKGLLIRQFIIESFVMACISGVIALLLVQLLLPAFNNLVAASLAVPYQSVLFWICGLAFVCFTSLLAGSYPAFYLASFNPVGIFKGKFKKAKGLLSVRRVLVVLQFSFAVLLIISTIVVRDQIRFAQERSTGFSGNNLVRVDFSGDIEKHFGEISNELMNAGIASSITKSMTTITQRGANSWGLRWQGRNPQFDDAIALYSSDANLIKTAGLQLKAGRDINIYQFPSDSTAVLLNETAVQTMGFRQPLGQIIAQPDDHTNWHVVGVVKDYLLSSPYAKVPPLMIEGPKSWFGTMMIKLAGGNSTAENLSRAEQIFRKYNPSYPFDYKFVDEEYARHFDTEQRTEKLSGLFAALAIFISCLGLFGLAAFVAEQRTKEIGIRKVLGASVSQVWMLLSKDFLLLVLISCVIASPIALYCLQEWLDKYAYRISINASVFVWSALMAIGITLVTVSFQAIRAGLANPVKSLRAE